MPESGSSAVTVTETEAALLPALSMHWPELVTIWLAVSMVTLLPATVLTASPEPPMLSAQVKLTVTGEVLFQPAPLGVGLTEAVITGGVVSQVAPAARLHGAKVTRVLTCEPLP